MLGELAAAIEREHGRDVRRRLEVERANLERDRSGRPRLHESHAAFESRRRRERRETAKLARELREPEPAPRPPMRGAERCPWCGEWLRRPPAPTCAECAPLERAYRLSTGRS